MSGFDINRSRVSATTLTEFINSPINKNLLTVPGVGDATIERLKTDGITTTHQLLGAYLKLCDEEFDSNQRTNAFWFYLRELQVSGSTRSTIVHAIAERINTLIPGMYDKE